MCRYKVMKLFADQHNIGILEDADAIGNMANPLCGDMMTFYIKVKNGAIEDIKYQAFNCVAAVAISSQVTEMVKGKSLKEAKKLVKKAVADALNGLSKRQLCCSNLGAEALLKAIKNYETSRQYTHPHRRERCAQYKICGSCWTKNPVTASFCMCCGGRLRT